MGAMNSMAPMVPSRPGGATRAAPMVPRRPPTQKPPTIPSRPNMWWSWYFNIIMTIFCVKLGVEYLWILIGSSNSANQIPSDQFRFPKISSLKIFLTLKNHAAFCHPSEPVLRKFIFWSLKSFQIFITLFSASNLQDTWKSAILVRCL